MPDLGLLPKLLDPAHAATGDLAAQVTRLGPDVQVMSHLATPGTTHRDEGD